MPLPAALEAQFNESQFRSAFLQEEKPAIAMPAFQAALPDGGLPRGAVVELTSRHGLGLVTSFALYACSCAQREAVKHGRDPAWCAWLDTSQTLYAPGVAAHGVALDRLLVVHPTTAALARIAVRMTVSRVFSTLIVDTQGVPGSPPQLASQVALQRWHNVVRRLSIAARECDTCVMLLTNRQHAASISLPVALRLELEQPRQRVIRVKAVKERHGRTGMPLEVPLDLDGARFSGSVVDRARWSQSSSDERMGVTEDALGQFRSTYPAVQDLQTAANTASPG